MNPDHLRQLGEPVLRRLARQAGLRGADLLDSEALRVGLAAYFAGETPEDEPPMEPPPQREPLRLPPALKTETMARLLEAQGRHIEASALRPDGQRAPVVVRAGAARISLSPTGGRLHASWEISGREAGPGTPTEPSCPPAGDRGNLALELHLFRGNGSRITRRISLQEASGVESLDMPPHVCHALAAVGWRDEDGRFHPLARSQVTSCTPDPNEGPRT